LKGKRRIEKKTEGGALTMIGQETGTDSAQSLKARAEKTAKKRGNKSKERGKKRAKEEKPPPARIVRTGRDLGKIRGGGRWGEKEREGGFVKGDPWVWWMGHEKEKKEGAQKSRKKEELQRSVEHNTFGI